MYLLFDIGGTKTRFALSLDGKRVGETRIFNTPARFSDGIALFKKAAEELSRGQKIRAIGGGIGGVIYKGRLLNSQKPNLVGWNNKPLQNRLRKEFGVSVFIENDAALEGLGESVYGAGRGKRIVAYITIGTGAGGVRIVDGKIDANSMGFEPGHQILCVDGPYCFACKGRGHLESYVSGSSLERRFHKKPYDVVDHKIWDEVALRLAQGLYNVMVFWSPDIIVLGGSMVLGKMPIPLGRVKQYLRRINTVFPGLPIITKAKLGEKSGLWGALHKIKAFSL